MPKGLEDFEAIFGEAKVECETTDISKRPHLRPFVFHVYAADRSTLKIHVSDFHSYTFESTRTVQHLEDLKDFIGVGGPWTEFLDYLISSLSSKNVKLALGGATSAKLLACISEGMPLISISLNRLMTTSANDVIANLSLELFKAFKHKHDEVAREQQRSCQLTERLVAEQEKKQTIHSQLNTITYSRKQKHQQFKASDKAFPISVSPMGLYAEAISDIQPEDSFTLDPKSPKFDDAIFSASGGVKGAILLDFEDNDDN